MTTVVVPCAVDAAGTLRQTRVVVQLVSRTPDRRWELAQGLRTLDGAPVAASFAFGIAPDDIDPVLKVSLYPQSEIASPIPTWYRFVVSIPFDREFVIEAYYVQVPAAESEMLLSALVGAQAIPPDSLPATVVADTLDAAARAEAAAVRAESVFGGFSRLEAVEALPETPDDDTLYLVFGI